MYTSFFFDYPLGALDPYICMKKPFICYQCGCEITPGRELIVANDYWATLVSRSKSVHDPKHTLLCPECIESLNGGPLGIEELIQKREGYEGTLPPMNLWYIRKNNIKVPLRYILGYFRYFRGLSSGPSMEELKRLWIECRECRFE